MKIAVLLADRGTPNVQAGTLNLLNVGWSFTALQPQLVPGPTGPETLWITPPHTVAIFFEVEHQRCNHPIELVLSLETEDGQPVLLPGDPASQDKQPMRMVQPVVVTSPAGAPIGSPGTGNALLEIIPGLPLEAGKAYCWRVELDGQSDEDWRVRFYVRALQQPSFTLGRGSAGPPGGN